MIASCTTISHNQQQNMLINYTNNPQVLDIINNNQSMTLYLKKLNSQFKVQELYNGIERGEYRRFVAISLDNTPVIVAISSTTPNNQVFYNILANSKNNSIGTKLFAHNSGIKRNPNMQIQTITVDNINGNILKNYLLKLGFSKNQPILMRISIFTTNNKNEQMHLTEFLLPSIVKFITTK